MEPYRSDPDQLLEALKQQEHTDHRGHLKIFFGYAAGVGKTYAMLKAAHAEKRRGIDVVAGYVEPHARPQTAALLHGLEQIQVRPVPHNGIMLNEFDLDAALKRKPKLALVDELAHTNAPGSRHSKRYQDIEELLKAGIDVYTTVNVQHIESLNDMVASITGILVRERIPDHVFDDADQVELVDIEPKELIDRLNAGQVYKEKQAQRAIANFFTMDNLTALREIALRRCADRVNKMTETARAKNRGDYYTDEHILVCLSSSPSNRKIIRTAARMANAFRGGFTALFVETPDFAGMGEEDKDRLRENIRIAQQLGAKIETVYGDDVAFQISEFARLSGVSKIVLGRNNARRRYPFGKPTLTEKLVAYSPNLDIHIIPDRDSRSYRMKSIPSEKQKFHPTDLIKTIGIIAVATFTGFIFEELGFSEANIITVYIFGVLITAFSTTQRVYSLASSILSVLIFNFFFTKPRFTLNAYDDGYPITFLIMFLAAFLTGSLTNKLKLHAKQSAQTAFRTKILFDTNQLLQQADGYKGIVSVTAGQLVKLLSRDIVFYPSEHGGLAAPHIFPASSQASDEGCMSENEQAVAAWVFKNNKHAGATTNTLSNAKCLYLAVRVNKSVYGVMGIVIGNRPLETFENSIVQSILGECALALENQEIAREKEEAAVLAKNEQLRANLLRSISHDLRTPLTSISGNASNLLTNSQTFDEETRRQLYSDIYEDSLWLINLVENLLSVTRIEEGKMQLHRSSELIDEVITEALRHVNRRRSDHTIQVEDSDEFILAQIDARMIVQVLINLMDNAIHYTPSGSTIVISATRQGDWVLVRVADDGPGIAPDMKPHIFDMFYTGANEIADSRRSLGLGLALCKSIVNAHGGGITVENAVPHGAVFSFTLPAKEVQLHE